MSEPRVLQVSYSSLNTFNSCARKFEFRKLLEAGGFIETLPTSVGQALHSAYQHWVVTGDKPAALWLLLQMYPHKWQKSAMDARSVYACYATLLAMMDNFKPAHDVAYIEHAGEKKPGIEVPFAIRIKDFWLDVDHTVTVEYVGFMDLILYDAFNETFAVEDVKTTRKSMSDYTPMYLFDEQCLPYALILQHIVGRPITSLDVTYNVCYIDPLEPRILPYRFHKTREDVDEWTRKLAITLRQMQMYWRSNWWPRSGGACVGWDTCYHIDYCNSRDPAHLKTVIELRQEANGYKPRTPIKPWFTMDLEIPGL